MSLKPLDLSVETEDKIKEIIRNILSFYNSQNCTQKLFSNYFLSQIGLSNYLENFDKEVKTYLDFCKIEFETLCNNAKIHVAAASSIILFRDYYVKEYEKFELCRKIYININKDYEDYVCEDFTNKILPELKLSEFKDYFESCNMSSELLKDYQKTELIKESSISQSKGNLLWDYIFYLSCSDIKKNFNNTKVTDKKNINYEESKEKETNRSNKKTNDEKEEIPKKKITNKIKKKKSEDEKSNDDEKIVDTETKLTDKKNMLMCLKNNEGEIGIVDKKDIHSKSEIKTGDETTIKYDYSIVFIEEFIYLKVGKKSLFNPYIQLKENKITLKNCMVLLIDNMLLKILTIDIEQNKISFSINTELKEITFEESELILISEGFVKMKNKHKNKEKYGTTEIIDNRLILNFNENIQKTIWVEINHKNNYFPLKLNDDFKIEANNFFVSENKHKFESFEDDKCYNNKCKSKSNQLLKFYPCKHKFICKDCHKKKYKDKKNDILFCYVCQKRFGFFYDKKK